MFGHVGFFEKTVGRPHQISLCNKSHVSFQVARGQRLGKLCSDIDWMEFFDGLDAKEVDEVLNQTSYSSRKQELQQLQCQGGGQGCGQQHKHQDRGVVC